MGYQATSGTAVDSQESSTPFQTPSDHVSKPQATEAARPHERTQRRDSVTASATITATYVYADVGMESQRDKRSVQQPHKAHGKSRHFLIKLPVQGSMVDKVRAVLAKPSIPVLKLDQSVSRSAGGSDSFQSAMPDSRGDSMAPKISTKIPMRASSVRASSSHHDDHTRAHPRTQTQAGAQVPFLDLGQILDDDTRPRKRRKAVSDYHRPGMYTQEVDVDKPEDRDYVPMSSEQSVEDKHMRGSL